MVETNDPENQSLWYSSKSPKTASNLIANFIVIQNTALQSKCRYNCKRRWLTCIQLNYETYQTFVAFLYHNVTLQLVNIQRLLINKISLSVIFKCVFSIFMVSLLSVGTVWCFFPQWSNQPVQNSITNSGRFEPMPRTMSKRREPSFTSGKLTVNRAAS